ncbi:hypothetical protein QBC44DRAFT_156058 [Cladorrhinum sp. PSN332]|nr:hypothetical protein QBC44DRAFT_156058 [Cladorrhinum sp. PSN332]
MSANRIASLGLCSLNLLTLGNGAENRCLGVPVPFVCVQRSSRVATRRRNSDSSGGRGRGIAVFFVARARAPSCAVVVVNLYFGNGNGRERREGFCVFRTTGTIDPFFFLAGFGGIRYLYTN